MAIFYVSPTGNDNQSGLDSSTAFATLARAQQAMRQSSSADTTYIAGGTYTLNTPLTLTAADSGSAFVAAPGETPVISGGAAVTNWTKGSNGIWTASVDASQVQQLTVNGVQQTQSRFPDFNPDDPIRGGWLWGQDAKGDALKTLTFNPADFPAGHAPQVGQQVTVFAENGYANDRLTIASVNGNVMTFTDEANYDLGAASRFYVSEAVPDGVGEWSFNAQTKTISFRAPDDFTGNGAVASADQSLFVLDGARDVTISGLTLTNTAAANGDNITAAIEANDTVGLTVEGNTFVNLGSGVVLHDQSSGNVITGNTFQHIWSSAIALTPQSSGNTISNNVIDRSNEVFVQHGAIDMTESGNNLISHNTISNVPRFGIAENNYDPNIASGGNTIEYNEVTQAGQQTPDVGGIYLFSAMDPGAAGDTIRYNKVVDTVGLNTRDGGFAENWSSGIYLDNLASNAQIYGNFVQGTSFSGIYVHGGSGNKVFDNTVLDSERYGVSVIGVDGFAMGGNEVYRNFLEAAADGGNTVDTDQTDTSLVHHNVYLTSGSGQISVADMSLSAFQARGGDAGSRTTSDAGFVDAAGGDFSFSAGSVAAALGIASVPFGSIGASHAGSQPNIPTVPTLPTPDIDEDIGVGPLPTEPEQPPVVVQPEVPVVPEPEVPDEPAKPPVVVEPSTPVVPPVVAEPSTPVTPEPEEPAGNGGWGNPGGWWSGGWGNGGWGHGGGFGGGHGGYQGNHGFNFFQFAKSQFADHHSGWHW
jgi:parallel beta-helix repeat protein